MFNTIRIFHFVAIENIQLKYLLLLISHNIINGQIQSKTHYYSTNKIIAAEAQFKTSSTQSVVIL